jgi:hypothetical protein
MSGRNSVVECQLPKLDVAGSTPVARSKILFNSLLLNAIFLSFEPKADKCPKRAQAESDIEAGDAPRDRSSFDCQENMSA